MDMLTIILISLVGLYFLDRSIFSSEPKYLGDWQTQKCGLEACKNNVYITNADYDFDEIYFCAYECEFKSCGLIDFSLRKIGKLLGTGFRYLFLAGCIIAFGSLFYMPINVLLVLILMALIIIIFTSK